ncbi:hypothetical protein Pth03_67860 [Planotetraspora thailandica]|uniref:Zinc transporter ZupT n=1 Tax=Planotetraspora thailandica TaxID=487172 RepID=A0A8J4DEI7_9ACTN|nr:hypothetical protein Pth03_67860 [Planotetraspora thailandica]
MLLVCISTVAGAWLARRHSGRVTAWLAVTSAMMLVTALADLLPDAWGDAVESGVPLWAVGLAVAFGFLVITHYSRKSCACDPVPVRPRPADHAPGRHRPVREVVGAAAFGGMETATALTLHRAIEGATLALNASVIVVVALMVHSASEGLALAALLDVGGQRLIPWLIVACVSPAVGVVAATLSPLPGQVVSILLGMVTGVALRTAIAGMQHAAGSRKWTFPSKRHLDVAAAVVVTGGIVLVAATGARAGHVTPSRPPAAAPTPATRGTPPAEMTKDQLRTAMSTGRLSLADVLARDDGMTRRLAVAWILRHVPGLGGADVQAALSALGIDGNSHVGDLGAAERAELLKTLPPKPH